MWLNNTLSVRTEVERNFRHIWAFNSIIVSVDLWDINVSIFSKPRLACNSKLVHGLQSFQLVAIHQVKFIYSHIKAVRWILCDNSLQ